MQGGSWLALQLRLIMISNMAKPEEVLVVENDDGEVVREAVKDTDTIELYKSMRVTLGTSVNVDREALYAAGLHCVLRGVCSLMQEADSRCVLVYLTHLDSQDTERLMSEKLARQVNKVRKASWLLGAVVLWTSAGLRTCASQYLIPPGIGGVLMAQSQHSVLGGGQHQRRHGHRR